MSNGLQLVARGDLAVATLDRPPANALDLGLLQAIVRALPDLRAARGVVITGAGRLFSAGLDLVQILGLDDAGAAEFANTFDDAMTGLFALENPVVAAINGHAVAGGAVIAAAADARLMADGSATIGLPELRVGVPFPTSALEIVRTAWPGPQLGLLLLRGLTYKPTDALALRLVDELVPAPEVLDRAVALAEELSAAPAVAYAQVKRALRADGLARCRAARGPSGDPSWGAWRHPEVVAAITAYRDRVLGKR